MNNYITSGAVKCPKTELNQINVDDSFLAIKWFLWAIHTDVFAYFLFTDTPREKEGKKTRYHQTKNNTNNDCEQQQQQQDIAKFSA